MVRLADSDWPQSCREGTLLRPRREPHGRGVEQSQSRQDRGQAEAPLTRFTRSRYSSSAYL